MFSSLRKRITVLFVGAVFLVLIVLTCVVTGSNYLCVLSQNMAMLDRYVGLYSLENPPGGRDMPPVPPDVFEVGRIAEGEALPPDFLFDDDTVGYTLSSFYSVSFGESDEVLFVDVGHTGLYSSTDLVGIARGVIQRGSDRGSEGPLLFRVVQKDGYTLVAFIDNSLVGESLRTLIADLLLGAGIALLLALLISFPVGKALVRPLEENDALQRRFISDAGHELKTPVSVIDVNAELLSRQLGENQWLDNIRYENRRMGELVVQLLDLSQVQENRAVYHPVDLSSLATSEAASFGGVADEASLTLATSIQGGIWVQGDAAQLAQLISILLDNAIAYTRGGEDITLELRRERQYAVLEVVNHAEGLDEGSLDHAFDRFFRVDEIRNDAGGHYGLGLSIAKAITESHGGSISLRYVDYSVRAVVQLPLKREPL